jgi:hypothetical protein
MKFTSIFLIRYMVCLCGIFEFGLFPASGITDGPIASDDRPAEGHHHHGGIGMGIGLSLDLGQLFAPKKKAPQETATTTKHSEEPKASKPKLVEIALNEQGRPISTAYTPCECCKFKTLRIRNIWDADIEISLVNDRNELVGQRTLKHGEDFNFEGDFGHFVHITVKSRIDPHLLIEDVHIACKDIGKKNIFFYGIQLLSFTKDNCGAPPPASTATTPTEEVKRPTEEPTPVASTPDEEGLPQSDFNRLVEEMRKKHLPTPIPTTVDRGTPTPLPTTVDGGTPTPYPTTIDRGTPTPTEPTETPTPTDPTPFPTTIERPTPTITPPPDLPVKLGILLERDNYWIPEADKTTQATATIFRWDPTYSRWVYPGLPRKITFHFVKRSKEEGVCLNYGHGDDPDIGIEPDKNKKLECSGENHMDSFDTAVTKNMVISQTVVLSNYDYGTFSRLEATADDCVPLKQAPDGTLIECSPVDAQKDIPKDDNNNQISDFYEDIQGEHPKADDDEDNNPIGNGKKGDGMTAYEEYRGFMCKGNFVRTSWDTKDLFIYNPDGFNVMEFDIKSGIACHEIDFDEYDLNRVVNFNRGHATIVQQHGLRLVDGDPGPGLAGKSVHWRALGWLGLDGTYLDDFLTWIAGGSGMGPPKNVVKVVISSGQMHAGLVPHELGHSVGVYHHGDGPFPPKKEMIYPNTTGNKILFWRNVHNGPTLGGQTLPAEFYIGIKNTQYSGDDHCIMRYFNNYQTAYKYNGDFEIADDDYKRDYFCNSSSGTGINADGHCAEDASKGDCIHQFVVSDMYGGN